MWCSASLPRLAAALLLAVALYPQSGLAAAATARFGVHLTIRESCEVRTDAANPVRGPAVDCRHGQSFAVSRHAASAASPTAAAPANSISRAAVAGVATDMWVVTF
jgi:hypothetical protein